MTADTQDDRSVVAVWGWSTNDNIYLLKGAEPKYLTISEQQRTRINQANKKIALQTRNQYKPIQTVQDILYDQYLVKDGVGIQPMFCLMDMRGHRMPDIEYFIKHHNNVLGWLGSRMSPNHEDHFEPSKTKYKAILADAKHWQKEAIHYLYDRKKRDEDYLFFLPDVDQRIIDQIASYKPDPNSKFGHYPENWTCGQKIHDYFDLTKMVYCAREYACKKMQLKRFRYCKSPLLIKRRQEQIKAVRQVKTQTKQNTEQKWIDLKYE